MSRFPSFLEYLNDKGVVVDKPNVEKVSDYHGPDEKTPEGGKVPYKTPLTPKAPEKGEKGLAQLGDDKLVYEPNTEVKYETKKDVMKESSAAMAPKSRVDMKGDYKGPKADAPKGGKPYIGKSIKPGDKPLGELGCQETKYEPDTEKAAKVTKTEGFINKTKNMSLAEFTKYMLEECGCGQVSGDDLPYVTAYSTGKIQPHPPEAIRYISALASKNSGILENLVSTMVSMGYLNTLLKTIFSYPQAYEELTSLFSDEKEGPDRCGSFVGAMNNSYGKFLSDQEGLYESVSGPIGFESDDEEDLEDDEDEDDIDGDEEDLGDDEFGPEEDLEDDEDEDEELEDDGDLDSEEKDLGDEESDIDMESNEGETEAPKPKRLKKKFAHDHLLNAMKRHEFMLKAMRGE